MNLHKYAQAERAQHLHRWKKLHRRIMPFSILAAIISIAGFFLDMTGPFTALSFILIIFGYLLPMLQQYQAVLRFEQGFNDLLLKQIETNAETTSKNS